MFFSVGESLIAVAERDGFGRAKLIRGAWKTEREASNETTMEKETAGEQEAETGLKERKLKTRKLGKHSHSDLLDPSIHRWDKSLLFRERVSAFQ